MSGGCCVALPRSLGRCWPPGSRMRWACAVRYSVLCSESSLILCFLISCPPRKRGTACDERDGPVVPRGHARMPGAAAVCPSLSFAGVPRSRTGAWFRLPGCVSRRGTQFPTCLGLAPSHWRAPPGPGRLFDGRGAFLELRSCSCRSCVPCLCASPSCLIVLEPGPGLAALASLLWSLRFCLVAEGEGRMANLIGLVRSLLHAFPGEVYFSSFPKSTLNRLLHSVSVMTWNATRRSRPIPPQWSGHRRATASGKHRFGGCRAGGGDEVGAPSCRCVGGT